MANQSNPIYSQQSASHSQSSVPRPARQASSQQHTDEVNHDSIYAQYATSNQANPTPSEHAAQSIYGGIDSSAYSHHSHAGQRGGPAASSTPPSAALPPLPTMQQHAPIQMYPSPTVAGNQPSNVGVGNYGNPNAAYMPRDDSVDVSDSALGHGDAASVHSRSHLNPPNSHNNNNAPPLFGGQNVPRGAQPLVARFQSDQIRPSAVYSNGAEVINEKAGNNSQPSSGGTLNEKARQLPEGYSTPPAFSRAGSGWTTSGLNNSSKSKKNNQNSNGNNNSPYGTLGGIASKSDPALQFAEGDYANTKFARFWLMILSKNIVIRWLCFIVPVLALLWIPGGFQRPPVFWPEFL